MALLIDSVGLIGFGEAGTLIGKDLGALGIRVVAFDRLIDDPDHSPALVEMARACNVTLKPTLEQVIDHVPFVISAVTPGNALEVARAVAARRCEGQIFMDINSVSPHTKKLACEAIEAGGAHYIDAAMMPVPSSRLITPILLGGTRAIDVAESLQALGFDARALSAQVGVPSAVKMCSSVMIKGLEALAVECLSAARQYGVEEAVLKSLHRSFPSMGWDGDLPDHLVGRVARHGGRHCDEMLDVAGSIQEFGISPRMCLAAAAVQAAVPDSMVEAEITSSDVNPFNWTHLVDGLYGKSIGQR